MSLRCPTCSASIVSEDVNIARLVAKCRSCNTVFAFQDQVGAAPPAPQVALAPVAMPSGIEVEVGAPAQVESYRTSGLSHGRLVLRRRWRTGQGFFMLVFAIAWNAFLVNWYGIAFAGGGPWIMFVFPIAHVAVGLGVAYGALTNLLNTTVFEIDGQSLRLRHGPIPARGNRELPIDELLQLYTEEHAGSKGSKSYALVAAVRSGPAIKLVEGLESREQALYIERAIETHLGILDTPPPAL
jgi:predicted Zn finger-like uncharacterized protein